MPTTLTFESHVSDSGYKWVPLDGEPWRFSPTWNPLGAATLEIGLVGKAQDMRYRNTRPTDSDAALFRNFAALQPTEDEIIEFAEQHGTLWLNAGAEPFGVWEYEIRTMRFLLEIWDATVARKTGWLADRFVVDKKGLTQLPFADSLLLYKPYADHRAKHFQGGKAHVEISDHVVAMRKPPISAARNYVAMAINCRLAELGPIVALDRFDKPFQMTMQPSSLLGALWLQFAFAVAESKEYRQCETCGTEFELSPDINRTSRLYCDDACRVKAYRQRKLEAKRLFSRGRTPAEIAAKLESDVSTIKKWLKPRGKK